MKINICNDYSAMSEYAAGLIIEYVGNKPDSLLCLAAGNTPLGTFSRLREAGLDGRASFEKCRFVSLDEWVGLGPEEEGSCRQTLDSHFFKPLSIRDSQIHFFNGTAEDLQAECIRMDEYIRSFGGIDFMLLGLGMNGHLGFNEPLADSSLASHIIPLDATTKQVSVKYFKEQKNVQFGITLGLKQIMETGTVVLLASGGEKADIVHKAFDGEATNRIPASLLQNHPQCRLVFDKEAAMKLTDFSR